VTAGKGALQDLTRQLGATSEDLATAEQDVKDAQQTAGQAQEARARDPVRLRGVVWPRTRDAKQLDHLAWWRSRMSE
jgi:hypothetical protein